MLKHLIKNEYKTLKPSEVKKATDFIKGKCSEYYFLDYLRCTNGNIDDAIEFYLLDDKLRSLFVQYLIRFEIQIKTDFVQMVQDSTHSSSFWNKRKFYLPDARHPRVRGRASKFYLMKKKIASNMARLSFNTMGPANYAAMYSSSFGTFQELFKLIDTPYKILFLNKYTSNMKRHDFQALNVFLEAIRRIRNRCAHGNHIITLKMVNDLNNLRSATTRNLLNANYHLTVMEAVIIFLIGQLNCGIEFKQRLISIISKHSELLIKYNGKHSLSANTINKIN